MKTIFSVCSGIWLDLSDLSTDREQRPETATLLRSGLVYLLLCFLSKVSTHHLLRLFNVCLLIDVFGKFLLCFYIQFTPMEIDSDL